jgi:hypothetical protein
MHWEQVEASPALPIRSDLAATGVLSRRSSQWRGSRCVMRKGKTEL